MRVVYLICLVVLFSCNEEDLSSQGLPEGFITFTPNPDELLANAADTLLISIDLGEGVKDLTANSFELSTTEGKFLSNGEAKLTTNGPAVTKLNGVDINPTIFARLLTTNKPGSHFLTIKRDMVFDRQIRMTFQPVGPNQVRVSKSKISVQNNFSDQVQLVATLVASEGKPSQGQTVEFIVADSLSSNDSPYFLNLKSSDANGNVTVDFTAGAYEGFEGAIAFKAMYPNAENMEFMASDSLIIYTKP